MTIAAFRTAAKHVQQRYGASSHAAGIDIFLKETTVARIPATRAMMTTNAPAGDRR
jgi:hypothetical protein